MPTISHFYGIIIVMYLRNKEHNPPHIHAITQDFDAPFLIETGELMEGEFPAKAQAMVKEFILKYREELEEMWESENILSFPRLIDMFHKAIKLEYGKGTNLVLTFQTGEIKEYDVSVLFQKYPQLTALKNRKLFLSGKLMGGYGIIWNDELDLEAETVYEEGHLIKKEDLSINITVANMLLAARANANLSQSELARITGINQADISKIENGIANPSIATLKRLANGLGAELKISFELKDAV